MRSAGGNGLELGEVEFRGEVVGFGEFGEGADAEIQFQFFREGRIVSDVLAGIGEMELVTSVAALEFDRDEKERGTVGGVGTGGVAPTEAPQSEEESVHPLFFDGGAGGVPGGEEALLQLD